MPRILFLMSDTGGGHRAACQAIQAALEQSYPGQFSFDAVDVWRDYMPFPSNWMAGQYGRWISVWPASYSAAYWIWDCLYRWPWFSRLSCRHLFVRMKRLYAEHVADLVVCLHSAFVRPAVYAARKLAMKTPVMAVITDYAWPITLWYDRQIDRCIVPTEGARRRGLSLGLSPSQLRLIGPPVHPKFGLLSITKEQAREQLGWPQQERVVLIMSGGEAAGPIARIARAIDQRRSDCRLVIIAGRNDRLRQELIDASWVRSPRIYGFVDNIEVFMRASDLLITKAGPGTITEAAVIGLPLLLTGAIKLQESPNAAYVVARGAGISADTARAVADRVEQLFGDGGTGLSALRANLPQIARSEAIWQIGDEIAACAGIEAAGGQISSGDRQFTESTVSK